MAWELSEPMDRETPSPDTFTGKRPNKLGRCRVNVRRVIRFYCARAAGR